MDNKITLVKILGAEYQISCPLEEVDQVKDAAKFFDKRLKEVKQNSKLEESKAAIIAGLNISNDYLKSLSHSDDAIKSKSDIEKLTSDIEKHIKSISKFEN